MNLTNRIERSWTQYILYDSTYIKLETSQDESQVLELRKMVTSAGRWYQKGEHRKPRWGGRQKYYFFF